MKTLKHFFLFFFLLIAQFSDAAILTVSNSPNLPAQYADINPAITAANTGDTIYIHGSPSWYGNAVYLSKRLVLIGPGYQPRTSSGQIVLINTMYISNKAASGSVISGLCFYSHVQGSVPASDTLNLTFRNCNIGTYLGNLSISFSFTSMVIENCIFPNGTIGIYTSAPVRSGLLVRNCIFGTPGGSGGGSIGDPVDNSIIDHNLFIGTNSVFRPITTGVNCTFSNNIVVQRLIDTSGSYASTGCVFLNNITYLCNNTLPTPNNSGSGNINAIPLFVNAPAFPFNISFSHNYRLAAGSPGKNAATDGTDIGVYGGSLGFSFTGESDALPVIRQMDIYNSVIPLNGNLDVRIKSTVPVR